MNQERERERESLDTRNVTLITQSSLIMGKGGQQQTASYQNLNHHATRPLTTGNDGESYCWSRPVRAKPHQQSDPNWEVLEEAERFHGRPLEMTDFTIMKKLGTGSSASVFLVKLRDSVCDARFALKVFQKKDFSRKNRVRRVVTEHSILSSTDHPFVVSLYRTFDQEGSIGFLMEYCKFGDMYQILQRQPLSRFQEYKVRVYAAQVAIALQYLHVQGYIYRDLKPENILLSKDGHVKLTDFDLSRAVKPPSMSVHQVEDKPSSLKGSSNRERRQRKKLRLVGVPQMRSTSFVGTDEYIAPEVITCRGYTSSVDWWSLGIFIYEMVYGVSPFASKNRNTCFKKIIEEELSFPPVPHVSESCKDLIRRLLSKSPSERLGSKYGASEIKAHPFFENIQWALLRYKQ